MDHLGRITVSGLPSFQPTLRPLLLATAVALALSACGGSSSSHRSTTAPTPVPPQLVLPGAGEQFAHHIALDHHPDAVRQHLITRGSSIQPVLDELLLPVVTPPAQVSQWQPQGPRLAAPADPVWGGHGAYRTLHADAVNSDTVHTAIAQPMQASWVAESELYLPEGATFDDAGNGYAVPTDPKEDVWLVKFDGRTGARLWAMGGRQFGQGGAPIILNHPQQPGEHIIIAASFDQVMAVDSHGNLLWATPTGLPRDPGRSTVLSRSFGANYHPATGSILTVFGNGAVVGHALADGRLLTPTAYQLPGSPPPRPPIEVKPELFMAELEGIIGHLFNDLQSFADITNLILGGDVEVANYFSIHPVTGQVVIASTAPDEADGHRDGVSEKGALYGLAVNTDSDGLLQFNIQWQQHFDGGSASTPALNATGDRIYVADDAGLVIAVNAATGQRIWEADTHAGQVVGSIAVDDERQEIYAATGTHIIKWFDQGHCAGDGQQCGQPAWRSNLPGVFDLSPLTDGSASTALHQRLGALLTLVMRGQGNSQFSYRTDTANMVLAGVTANGIVAQAGFGWEAGPGRVLPFQLAQVVLDRADGSVLHSTPALEESVAVMSSASSGDLYMGNSPIRRVLSDALIQRAGTTLQLENFAEFGYRAYGGITRFGLSTASHQWRRMVDDLLRAMTLRLENHRDSAADPGWHSDAVDANFNQVSLLLAQLPDALAVGEQLGELGADAARYQQLQVDLADALARQHLADALAALAAL